MLYPQINEKRSVISLDGVWSFCLDDGSNGGNINSGFIERNGETIAVPASYNDQKDDLRFREHCGWAYYSRRFTVPEIYRNERLVLRFDAVTHYAKVYIDGKLVCEHKGGFLPFEIELDSAEPQVLILHTHATETYQLWDDLVFDPSFAARTQDKTANMCAVGARMAEVLNAAGINTLHDETLHDSPSYTESYGRSAQTARAYLEQYPSIKVILDVHRDAIEADGMRIKPVADINGEPTAQVMLIAGCDNGTTVNLPRWEQNLAFAAAWEQAMESAYPGLTRPVLCGYRFYNQDITTGSLLIEVGGHANTLAEAVRAGEYAARALAGVLGASA